MQTPRISVVLPTYNRTATLSRAVRSVLAQTFRDLELIVVDDASTEDVSGALAQFSDPRIRYIRRDSNGGPAAARNQGVREARGQWIAFQDSDDEWLITKLQQQMAAVEGATPPALVCGSYIMIRRKRGARLVGPTADMLTGTWNARSLYDFPFIAPTWLVRRDLFLQLDGFDESLPNLEDWEFIFRLHGHGRMQVLNQPLLVKHTEGDSINTNLSKRLASLEHILERHQPLFSASPAVLAAFLTEMGRIRCLKRDMPGSRSAFLRALRLQPDWYRLASYFAAFAGPRGMRFLYRHSVRLRTL